MPSCTVMRSLGVAGLVVFVVACGAQTEEAGSRRQRGPDPSAAEPAVDGSQGQEASGIARGQSQIDFGGSVELPPCELGESPTEVSECVFEGNGLCYETVLDACACVCPRRDNTTCISDLFPNTIGALEVLCG